MGCAPPACGIEKRSLNCLVGSFRVGKNSGENDLYKYYIAACIYVIYTRTIDTCIELICAEEKEIETTAEGILLRNQSIEHY